MQRTFEDRLQWDLKNHRHGLLEAIVAGNTNNLETVLDAIALQCEIMRRQAIEHFEKATVGNCICGAQTLAEKLSTICQHFRYHANLEWTQTIAEDCLPRSLFERLWFRVQPTKALDLR